MSDVRVYKPKRPGCTCSAAGSVDGCYHHDPDREEERKKNARKATGAKADKEVREVKAEIRELVQMVKAGRIDVSRANTMNRLYQTLLTYILAERGIYREEDLAVRIRELGNPG